MNLPQEQFGFDLPGAPALAHPAESSISNAVEYIKREEKNDFRARRLQNILGKNTGANVGRCADRIRQQMKFLTPEAQEKIESDYLLDVVWRTYLEKMHALLSILTTDVVEFIEAMQEIPQARTIHGIEKSPRRIQMSCLQDFFRRLEPFIFLNLLRQEDLGEKDIHHGFGDGLLIVVGRTKDHTPGEFQPAVGISFSEPLGRNLSLEDQRKLPAELSRITQGHTHRTLGKLAMPALIQQSQIANRRLLTTKSMRLAATSYTGIKPVTVRLVHPRGCLEPIEPSVNAQNRIGHAYAMDMAPLTELV